MSTRAKSLTAPAICLLLAVTALVAGRLTAEAGNPYGASYCTANDRIFWFVHVSDLHIGASGSTDANRFQWIVTTGLDVIEPAFVVATGDLTDSTAGNLFGYPNGPHQSEWTEYKAIVDGAGAGPTVFYDLPGNHDAYSDATFAYYRANSVQGRATGKTQISWTREYAFGKYHFLGVNTADNSGAPFSLTRPWGDYAGLDATELAFISDELARHDDADLTLVFGHHPVTDTGSSDDTWLFYGHQDFIHALDIYRASLYDYGHTHDASEALFTGNSYTGLMAGGGIHYYNVASLAKSTASNFSVVAIDCNGVSSVTQTAGTWPVVLITAPIDSRIGSSANPYSYTVPAVPANPIRALVFDANAVTQVSYRIDGAGNWYPMTRVAANPALWQATWNASNLAAGNHTIEVQAVGSSTRSNITTVYVTGSTNRAPVAVDDSYSTTKDVVLTVPVRGVLANDSDPDGDMLTAERRSAPAHGTVTLNADGSFTYTPSAGYLGADSFTYVARDASLASNVATVSIAVTAAADTVTIRSATYTSKRKVLSVEATSTAQPSAILSVVGYGQMTFKRKTNTYTYQATVSSKPAEVTVQSSLGGSATSVVTVK